MSLSTGRVLHLYWQNGNFDQKFHPELSFSGSSLHTFSQSQSSSVSSSTVTSEAGAMIIAAEGATKSSSD